MNFQKQFEVQAVLVVRENNMSIEELNAMRAIQSISHKIDGFKLRDYFAGQALAGIMSNVKDDFGDNPLETIAQICYSYADALIKQRN